MVLGVPSLRSQITSRLLADTAVAAIAVGGVYTKPLDRGVTPDAFSDKGHTRTSIVVRLQTANGVIHVDNQNLSLWCYAHASDTGKDQLDQLTEAVRRCLTKWQFTTANGTGGEITRLVGDTGADDDPVLPNTVLRVLRFQGASLWQPIS